MVLGALPNMNLLKLGGRMVSTEGLGVASEEGCCCGGYVCVGEGDCMEELAAIIILGWEREEVVICLLLLLSQLVCLGLGDAIPD